MESPTTRPLTEDERIEYAEIGQFYRHDDTIIYQLAAVLLPLSFGAVVAAAQYLNLRYFLFLGSIALYSFWFLVSIRLSWFSRVRMERARELEQTAGLNHHQIVHDPPAHLRHIGSRISIRLLRLVVFVVLLVIWAAVLYRARNL